jgi:PAS domain-containing protein
MTAHADASQPPSLLAGHRSRMSSLLADLHAEIPRPVLAELSAVEEELAVADEELRVQNEELTSSRTAMESIASRYRELFTSAPTALAITDRFGVVLERNRAAAELLAEPLGQVRRRPIVTRFELADRQAARSLIVKALSRARPAEATLRLSTAAGARPVTVRVATFVDTHAAEPRLSWEIATGRAAPTTEPAPSQSADAESALAATIRKLMVEDLDSDATPEYEPSAAATRVTALAKRLVPHTDWATVTILTERGTLETVAATDSIAERLDRVQQRVGEGPAVQAMSERRVVRHDIVAGRPPWPNFGSAVGEYGVRSAVSCHFPVVHGLRGALALYSARPAAFLSAADILVPLLAGRVATALAYSEKVANLQRAVQSRQVIGQACGVLMERHRLTSDAAFQRMVGASQTKHLKLRDLARQIVETGLDPENL